MNSGVSINENASRLLCRTPGADSQRRMVLAEWINTTVPNFYLSIKASDEELRASLLDGIVLCRLLNKLKPSSVNEGLDPGKSYERLQKFLEVVAELGLPGFEIADLEKGSMKPVIDCLFSLKDRFTPHFVGSKFPQSPRSPCSPVSPESQAASVYGAHRFPTFRISESMKSNSLDNAPTQSLLSAVYGILDECVERKNTEMPQRVACLLRNIVHEIERRISTQAEHLRVQSNLYKTREEKLQSRIRVLEVLASGASAESESGRLKIEDMGKNEDIEVVQLKKEKDQSHLELSMLKRELEMIKKKYELQSLEMETQSKSVKKELEQKIIEQELLLESTKKRVEESRKNEDKEVAQLQKEKDQSDFELSTLKLELETMKKRYELHCQDMETQSKLVKSELEQKIAAQVLLLEDAKNKVKSAEVNAESKCKKWMQKQHAIDDFINDHSSSLQELRNFSESIKVELVKTQKCYMQELERSGKKLNSIAEAAQKYHQVLNENRKIYNELQDLKGNIRVYCRVRPFLPGDSGKDTVVESIGENGEVTIASPSKGKDAQKTFKFNKVYGPSASQAEVFADTQPLIRTILDGYNVCIFAYGQTGSGKTYTMTGPEGATKENWGVNYRALDDLFQISEDRKDCYQYEIGVQMVEIYNEQIRDLLSSDRSQKNLGVLAGTPPNGLAVPDASMHPVHSTSDVIELMSLGHTNRSVSSTAMNERSSRSHSVVTIHVQGMNMKSGATTHASLHLVDLAGSERVDRSEVTGDRLKEAQHINKSLAALGDVIFSLAAKSPHVPYRNSKLTQVLQSSLGGRAKTLMFVQLNPDLNSYSETLGTLKFAERVAAVELGAARSNREGKDTRELTEQVASLKEMLAQKDEEIERLTLLRDPNSSSSTIRRSSSSSKLRPSSPSTSPIGSSHIHSPTASNGRRSVSLQKGGAGSSDQENSEHVSDKQSDAGSQKQDNEDRLSEASEGDEGEDDDSAAEGSPRVSARRGEGNVEKSKSATKGLSPRSRVAAPSTPSRLSQVKSTLRVTTALKNSSSGGTSSPGAPSRKSSVSGGSPSSVRRGL